MASGTAEKQHTSIEQWFDDLVATLRTHQLQLEQDIANKELKVIYDTLLSKNADEISYLQKSLAQKHFVANIIFRYLTILKQADNLPLKLAFDFNDSEVLVWAEIEDDDWEAEKGLLIAEAKVNAQYHPYGYDMRSTIVEECDKLEIPNHYKVFKGKES